MAETLAITAIWRGLCEAGVPEVMLYLPDGSASRCHWRDTAEIQGCRVALVGDLDRGIVRLVPVDTCTGIGVAAPKGTDPMGYRAVILERLSGLAVAPEASGT